jgi:hypothetical protein
VVVETYQLFEVCIQFQVRYLAPMQGDMTIAAYSCKRSDGMLDFTR